MKRRTFLIVSMAAATAVRRAWGQGDARLAENWTSSSNAAVLAKRSYGDTPERLSLIGFGGMVVAGMKQRAANRLVAEAVERGVNYFDVAPTYGNAEERLGPALKPYRQQVFLACKTRQRQRKPAELEFERSLKRLGTDHFDLYQIHGISSVEEDVEPVFAKGGAMEMLIEAKKAGQIRYLGFSAHSEEAALAALDRYEFDSALFPVNFACWYKGALGPRIVARARERGAACLALKAMACQRWPKDDPRRKQYPKCWYQPLTDPHEVELALRWTLSRPVTAAIPPGDESLFRLALDIASRFTPVTPAEEDDLKTRAQILTPIFGTTA